MMRVNSTFSASRYAGVAATLVWSLGWIAAACVALLRLGQAGADRGLVNMAVGLVLAALGLIVTVRSARHKPAAEPEGKPIHESWAHRFGTWVATVAWCGIGFVWNVAVFSSLIRASYAGQCLTLLILIPFSLIGLFLLLVMFTGLGVAVDSLLHIGQPTSAIVVQQSTGLPESQPTQSTGRSSGDFLRTSPVLGTLLLISFLNWFVFFGISMYFGGDALGTLPSRDGFVVTSHGHHKAVSESVWRFSLFYSGTTLLVTPLIWLIFAARQFAGQVKQASRWKVLLVGGFILVWVVGWYSSIGSSMRRSIVDWKQYQRPKPAAPNPAIASRLTARRHWRRVGELNRSGDYHVYRFSNCSLHCCQSCVVRL